jgi:iron complex outermembrane receptor protein
MRLSARLLLVTAAASLIPATHLHAQTVNYAALQDTLGEPVTTSVTGSPQRQSDAPAEIEIITREQISRSPARSVPDLLRTYAGVDVNHWTAGQSDVAVRGGVQPYNAGLLVLVNGRQVYLDHYGMTDWNLLGIPLEAIQQIELVRGPAGALFGFNAASGVVNIITVDPLQGRQASATAEAGNHGYSRISGTLGTPIGDDVAVTLSGGHQREDERRIPDTVGHPAATPAVLADQVSGSVVALPGAATRLDLNGGYASNRELEILPSGVPLVQYYRTESAGLSISHDTGWGSVDGKAYTNWLHVEDGVTGPPPGPFGGVAGSVVDNRTIVAELASLVRIGGSDTLRIGTEYRDNSIAGATFYSHHVGYQLLSANAMVDLHPSARLKLSVAVRVDHLWLNQDGPPVAPVIDPPTAYDRTLTGISFNAAALLAVGQNGQLRINGGRAIQSPSLIDFGLRTRVPDGYSPLPIYTTGDPAVDPTIVWSVEAGYVHHLGSSVRVEGTVFYTHTEDAIAAPGDGASYALIATPAPSLLTRLANVGSFTSHGISLSGTGDLAGGFGWLANYTWTQVDQNLPAAVAPYMISLAPAVTTPEHVANVGASYGGGRWSGAATVHVTSASRQFVFNSRAALELFPVAAAAALDAKLGYRLAHGVTLFVAGENLTDAGGASGSPIPADRRVRAGAHLAL